MEISRMRKQCELGLSPTQGPEMRLSSDSTSGKLSRRLEEFSSLYSAFILQNEKRVQKGWSNSPYLYFSCYSFVEVGRIILSHPLYSFVGYCGN